MLPGNGSQVVKLEISLDHRTGGISVNGPIDNPFVCYAMLELAKDAIRAHTASKSKSSIVVPTLEFSGARQ